MSVNYLLVIVSVPNITVARKLVAVTLKHRLAACVQVTEQVRSTYWWQGVLTSSRERICIFKTTSEHYPKLEQVIKKVHPYENPEILALPIVTGSEEYLRWLTQELKSPRNGEQG